jgi:transcriptional regulator with XRE-family HTH domain
MTQLPGTRKRGSDPRAAIAEAVRRARDERGMTQFEVAVLAETRTSTVCQVEKAKGNPTLETLDKITSALGLTITIEDDAA